MPSFLDLFGQLIKQSREGQGQTDGPLEHYRAQGKMKKHEDLIPGGLADNKPDKLYDKKQIRKGIKVELEHVNDTRRAKEIAKDHLEEQRGAGEKQNYYDKLQKMEGKAKHANALVKAAVGLARANRLAASAMKNPNPQVAQAATMAANQVHQKRRNIRGIEPGAELRARVSNDPNHPMHMQPTPKPMHNLPEIQRKAKERELYLNTPPAEYASSPRGAAALANKVAELAVQPEVGQPMPTKAQEKGQDKSESGEFRGTTSNVSSLTLANADLMLRSKDNIDARITELQQIMEAEDPETGAPGELLPEEEEELHRLSNMSDGLNKLLRKRLYNIDEDLDHGQMEAVKDLLMAGSEGSYAEDGEPWTPELVEKAAYEIEWKPSGLGDKRKPPEKGRQREKEEERVTQTEKYREARKLPRETVNPKSGVGSVEQRYSEGNGTIDEPTQVMPNKMGADDTRARAEVIVFTPKGVYGLRRGKHWLAFPGGGIEDGEDPVDAARREVVEEADLNLKDLKSLGTDIVTIPKEMRGKGKAGRNHARSKNHVFIAESAGKLKTSHKDRERFHVYDFDRAIEILTAALDDPEAAAFKSMNKKRVSAVQQAKQLAAAS